MPLKIAIIGQQDFGKAVLEAFLARGDAVAGVFCAPEKPGARPDVLKVAAQEKGVKVFQFPSLKGEEARKALQDLDVEIGVMAYVLQFAPQEFVNIPKHGTIQYHPSLLPKYGGKGMYGRKVLLLERHNAPGGLNSFYARGARRYDVGLHALTNWVPEGAKGAPLVKLMRQLRIRREELDLCPQLGSRVVMAGRRKSPISAAGRISPRAGPSRKPNSSRKTMASAISTRRPAPPAGSRSRRRAFGMPWRVTPRFWAICSMIRAVPTNRPAP